MLYFLGAGVLLTLNRYLNIGKKKYSETSQTSMMELFAKYVND